MDERATAGEKVTDRLQDCGIRLDQKTSGQRYGERDFLFRVADPLYKPLEERSAKSGRPVEIDEAFDGKTRVENHRVVQHERVDVWPWSSRWSTLLFCSAPLEVSANCLIRGLQLFDSPNRQRQNNRQRG